jgi:hypothetical protein
MGKGPSSRRDFGSVGVALSQTVASKDIGGGAWDVMRRALTRNGGGSISGALPDDSTFQATATLDDDHLDGDDYAWQWDLDGALGDGATLTPTSDLGLWLVACSFKIDATTSTAGAGVAELGVFGMVSDPAPGQIVVDGGSSVHSGTTITDFAPIGGAASLTFSGPFFPGLGLTWTIEVTGWRFG